jgi:hypothetical protein
MAFGGDDDRRVRRKFDAPREKPLSHRGRGAVGSKELLETGGAVMRKFNMRKLWKEPDVSSHLTHV